MEKLKPRLIALDLDDTLLKDDLSISDFTVSVLQKTAEAGIYVVLCSGRTDNAILPFVRRLQVAGYEAGRYIIAQNGASVYDLHERRTIFEKLVDPDVLIDAYNLACENGLNISEVYDASTIYIPAENDWTELDIKLSGLKKKVVPEFEEFLRKGHQKMVIPGEPEELQKFIPKLKEKIGGKAVIFISKPFFLEILPFNCGKGEAVLWLADRLSLTQKDTMGFGDSMNDESMITLTNYSVAMKNGLDVIKKQAAFITDYSNNEDGLAHFIEDYVL